jgi:hypothetical protein
MSNHDDPITPPHPLPDPNTPAEALIALVRLQTEQLQELRQLREELEEQRFAVEQIKLWMDEYLDKVYKETPRWQRMRTYIGVWFWLSIGIPVAYIALWMLFYIIIPMFIPR